MIAGTIRNTVKMAALDGAWQQKKASGELGSSKKKELTAAERELARMQEQAEEIRQGREDAGIDAKLKAGQKLTPEEIAYLKKNNPQALKEYEEIQEQRKAYKEALKNCRSKEEVEQLKVTKLGQFMAQAKEISNNPNIPKGQKKAMLERLMRFLSGIQKEHQAFEKTAQYRMLPEKEEDARRRRGGGAEDIQEGSQGDIQTDGQKDGQEEGQRDVQGAGSGEPELSECWPQEETGKALEPFLEDVESGSRSAAVSGHTAVEHSAGAGRDAAGMLVDLRL
ncbi:MAG: hypothetical protein NC399_08280 [Muribaculum sp.]|nr:hypothetical protein [Muribaculum sp.]